MRREIQTPHGFIRLEYEGGGVYQAPLPWLPGRGYIVIHDRQQAQFKVFARAGKKASAVGSGKDLDEACVIIRKHIDTIDTKAHRVNNQNDGRSPHDINAKFES